MHAEQVQTTAEGADLWERLASASGTQFDYASWLELQCRWLAGAEVGLVALRESDTRFVPAAFWSRAGAGSEPLSELVDQVLVEGCGLATVLATGGFGIGYPVRISGKLQAVVCVQLNAEDEAALNQAMRQLQWGASWLVQAALQGEQQLKLSDQKQLATAMELLSRVLAEPDFETAALCLVTELARLMESELVSLAEWQSGSARVLHLSHSAEFGRKMNLVQALERTMEEAVDQRQSLRYPSADQDSGLVLLAHRELAGLLDRANLLSVPLYNADQTEVIGCICLQRVEERPFSDDERRFCDSILALACAALWEKKANDQPLYQRALDSAKLQLKRLFGPRHTARKLGITLLTALVLFCTLVDGQYRLSADATLEAALQRMLVAPYDGFVEQAPVRAGDRVEAGTLLARLDDKDLQLQRLKWLSQQNRLQRRYQEAMAEHDRASVNIINAQLDQARAELKLLAIQLQRAQLTAPFAGLVVSGDLSQRLGGAVAQGELLFTVSPEGAYRVALKVRESRIADLAPGQRGVLYLSAIPDQPLPIRIDKLTPITLSEEGASYFRVEALLQEPVAGLQVGMQGVGKILIDERSLISIWSRDLVEWLRLELWSWWG